MGFRARCKFCHQTEFGSMGAHRRHVKWHISRGDAVVMEQTLHPKAEPIKVLCKPEEVAELERQGWTRKPPTTEETPE